MLAAIALMLCTVVLFKMKRQRYAWVTIMPTAWLLICTLTAGWQKMFSSNPAIGFLSHRSKFADAFAQGQVLAPAKSLDDMRAILVNDAVDAALCAVFVAVVVAMLVYGLLAVRRALSDPNQSAKEMAYDLQMVRPGA
jgi:carbon starvation protein CstA